MSPIKDKSLASYSKENLIILENFEENQQLSIEDLVLPIFVNSSQIFFKGLLVIAINKVQSFSYN